MPEQSIIDLLQSSESEDIREGAYLAGKGGVKEAIPFLVPHIQNADIGVQEAVDRALRKIGGPDVVSAVIPLLRSEDAPVRNIAMDILRVVGVENIEPLFQLLHDADPDMRIFASDILGSSNSVLAVPPLCGALLRDPEVNVRYQAAVSLGSLGFQEAAPSLNKALEDEEWVQFSVVEALIKLRAESSIGALVKALDSSSELVASIIIDALGEMGNIKAVPLLLRRLDTTTGPLRNKIVTSIIKILGEKSLGLLGSKEKEKLYAYMLVAIKDDDEEVQDMMVRGLAGVGGVQASTAIAALAEQLDPDRDHERMVMMVDALAKIGFNETIAALIRDGEELAQHIGVEVASRAPSREAIVLLKSVLWDKPRDLQRSIIIELAKHCGPEDQDFFLDVLDRITDGNVIKAALLFLGRKGEASEVSPVVTHFLEHDYDDVKEAALDACIALHDPLTVGYLLGMAEEEEPIRRMMAVYALGAIDVTAYEHIVFKALDDGVMDVRRVALEALGRKTPLPQAYQDALVAKFDDPESEVRLAVISVLSAGKAPALRDCLLRGLEDSDPWVRVRCIENIGRLGLEDAVPRLVEQLHDTNELIVIKTIEVLGSMGGELAFRSLFDLIDHENPEIQHAAEEAVERIRSDEGA
ncbi:PBS lyase HEAT domain protein repeat-containing protein [uncultured delta proteobacterium]|uniref:PBS lyase HEAT domain protein repeat-containing protein n=1 Tax=uncultured delta proteobacterium TaxID=34034 RepID=A0A212J0A2_9DELT|nr:PBS lyase HEAT domain protein repeat-containing protein [uncultured delta proteobacterium]